MEGTYIKEKNIEFSLANLDEYEEVSIWQTYDKKGQEIVDCKGTVLQFPIKDGVLYDKDGVERPFDKLVKMPNPIFRALFPNLTKNKRFLRTIIIEGVECYYNFTQSANNRLKEQIETLQNMGQNPLKVLFKQSFNKDAKANDMYKISVIGKVDSPAPSAPQTPVATGAVKIDISDKPSLNAIETELLDALKKLDNKLSSEQFNKICLDNAISDETRIKELWEMYDKAQ